MGSPEYYALIAKLRAANRARKEARRARLIALHGEIGASLMLAREAMARVAR